MIRSYQVYLTVACPTCGAERYAPCKTLAGTRYTVTPHKARDVLVARYTSDEVRAALDGYRQEMARRREVSSRHFRSPDASLPPERQDPA